MIKQCFMSVLTVVLTERMETCFCFHSQSSPGQARPSGPPLVEKKTAKDWSILGFHLEWWKVKFGESQPFFQIDTRW